MARAVEEYLKPEVVRRIARLDLRAQFIVQGFLQGLHASPYQGFSVEFSEHRRYAPGDDPKDIDWLVPHQANRRIIDGMARKLALPPERVVVTVDRHANTSAASIPLALWEATKENRIAPGDIVLLEAIGGGLTWGACVVRW